MATVVNCKYCNEMLMAEFPEGATEKEKERMTIEFCECKAAKKETERLSELELAKLRIEELFGDKSEELGFNVIDSQKVHDLMIKAAELISFGLIRSASIDITNKNKTTAKISDGGIKIDIERTQTKKRKL